MTEMAAGIIIWTFKDPLGPISFRGRKDNTKQLKLFEVINKLQNINKTL